MNPLLIQQIPLKERGLIILALSTLAAMLPSDHPSKNEALGLMSNLIQPVANDDRASITRSVIVDGIQMNLQVDLRK